MSENESKIVVNVPVGIVNQHAWLRKSADWVTRISRAMGERMADEPDRGTARDAQMRIRLYALNGIGERLHVLLRIADRDSERVQTALVRQLLEFVALGAYIEPLKPQFTNNKWVFVRHGNANRPVKTYGVKFVARGLSNLTGRHVTDDVMANVVTIYTIYANTSAYTHPSPQELACFVTTSTGRRAATAPGIEHYADILHSLLSTLCLKLDRDYELGELEQAEILRYRDATLQRMQDRNKGSS